MAFRTASPWQPWLIGLAIFVVGLIMARDRVPRAAVFVSALTLAQRAPPRHLRGSPTPIRGSDPDATDAAGCVTRRLAGGERPVAAPLPPRLPSPPERCRRGEARAAEITPAPIDAGACFRYPEA
jgi:hypothetical protein